MGYDLLWLAAKGPCFRLGKTYRCGAPRLVTRLVHQRGSAAGEDTARGGADGRRGPPAGVEGVARCPAQWMQLHPPGPGQAPVRGTAGSSAGRAGQPRRRFQAKRGIHGGVPVQDSNRADDPVNAPGGGGRCTPWRRTLRPPMRTLRRVSRGVVHPAQASDAHFRFRAYVSSLSL